MGIKARTWKGNLALLIWLRMEVQNMKCLPRLTLEGKREKQVLSLLIVSSPCLDLGFEFWK